MTRHQLDLLFQYIDASIKGSTAAFVNRQPARQRAEQLKQELYRTSDENNGRS
jgi:hypothetical protein